MEFIFQFIWTPIAVFLVGYILLRVMGKKAVAKMTSFDLIVVLILGTTITEPIVTKRLGLASYYSVVIALVYLVISKLSLDNRFKKYLATSPTVIVRNGDIDEKGLRKVGISVENLLGLLREKGYTSPSQLALVTVEEEGTLSCIPHSDQRPIQPSDFQMVPKPTFIPIPLIVDGEIVHHNLKFLQQDEGWLEKMLKPHNFTLNDVKRITLATYNEQGLLDVDTENPQNRDQGTYNYKPGNDN
ncbi:hypothetical protein HMPREF9374_1413 [Desmospora sp. 8437]|nr:hypothetical protein HMPREF9374_1413 [Desmospora sp. 8437]